MRRFLLTLAVLLSLATPAHATRLVVKWFPSTPAATRANTHARYHAQRIAFRELDRLGLDLVGAPAIAECQYRCTPEVEWVEEDRLILAAQVLESRAECLPQDVILGSSLEVFCPRTPDVSILGDVGLEYGLETPNDPLYPQQWHLERINAPAAWAYTVGDPALIVAVADTGIVTTNRDLFPLLLLPGYNSADGTASTNDNNGHGTACASLVGVLTNNAFGMAGLNWSLRIMPVKVTNDPRSYASWSAIAAGWVWAVDHGAKIVTCSYAPTGSATVEAAAKYAWERGVIVFVAAGNENADLLTPDSQYMVTVAATDQNDLRASFSNRGPCVDLAAPGVNVYGAMWYDGFRLMSGTSASTPIVAGVAALLRATRPDLAPVDLEAILEQSAVDLGTAGRDNLFGAGRVDAGAALALAQGWVATVEPPIEPPVIPPPPKWPGRKWWRR